MPELNLLAQKAARVLTHRLAQAVTLVEPQLLKDETRSLVVRCAVKPRKPDGSVPTSVIIKQMRADSARGFSDWASLVFLADIPATRGLVPQFFAGDQAEHFFVMEDLGGSQNLEAILKQNDPQLARATLRTLATRMAQLSGATLTSERTFDTLRNALPAAAGLGRYLEAEQWRQGQDKIARWFEAAHCPLPHGFMSCLEQIAADYAEPGPFLCFTHGDPAPTNNHIRDGQVRLLDFEYGGFRHALYDITGWNILCPLPACCVQEMSDCFQQELAITCSTAADKTQYAAAWALLCAFRALAILTWISPDTLQANRPWVDETWTSRHAVLAAMIRLHAATSASATLAPVGEAAAWLLTALRLHWPEFENAADVTPPWPTFAGQ